MMKRIALAAGMILLAAVVSSNAFALSLSVDVPMSYTLNNSTFSPSGAKFTSADASSVSGFKVAVKLPFFLGIGYEDYKAGFTVDPAVTSGQNVKILSAFKIYDLFVELPFPFIHITLGAGIGEAKGETDPLNMASFKAAAVTQYFASLGLPIGKVLDVHVGYHVVNVADMEFTPTGGSADKARLSGNMLSAGIRLGF